MLRVNEVVKVLLLSAVVVMVVGCGSGGGGSSSLVGRWALEEGNSTPRGFPGNMELLKDGTGVSDKASITWKTAGGRIYLSAMGQATVFNYKLSGGVLTFTDDNGKAVTYLTQAAKEAKVAKAAAEFAKTVRKVTIGGKTWMAENLNYQTLSGSWCYDNNNQNCTKYGRLYDLETAKTACPKGWHLPFRQEWNDLVLATGDKVAGKKLNSKNGWDDVFNGTDDYGFSALPGGWRNTGGSFDGADYDGYWWTATENGNSNAYARRISFLTDGVYEDDLDVSLGLSVRCVADN